MKFLSMSKVRDQLGSDVTLRKTRTLAGRTARALPSATFEYLLDKVPVVGWLPKYNYRWTVNDVIGGLTVACLLVPQSLAYAQLATIPTQYGLMSSWLPPLLYFFMGTSKDLSTGPTSLMGLLTAEIIRDVQEEGYSPQAIASAVAMAVGIYALGIGLLKAGFLLDYISAPVLNGFISAAAIVIMLGQIPSLFGITVGTGTTTIVHDFFAGITTTSWQTVLVGFSSIVLLVILQKVGQKWGKTNKFAFFLSLARSALVLALFTGISYGVCKDIDLDNEDPPFKLAKVKSSGILAPKMPDVALLKIVFGRSIAPFVAAALEHLAIAKAFGKKNDYVIDQSQELVYLGTTNFFNSFFSSMSVSGAMSRTAVNSESGVKSPAYGLITGGFVLLSIFKLGGALFWIPKATLAAIIVTAVYHLVSPPSLWYHYWRTSLPDFVAAMLSFFVTLFVNTETGIGCAVGFCIVYTLLRVAFARVNRVTDVARFQSPLNSPPAFQQDFPKLSQQDSVLSYNSKNPLFASQNQLYDTMVFEFEQAIFFPNAYSVKGQCLDDVQTYTSGSAAALADQAKNRNWSVSGARKLRKLRAKANIINDPPCVRIVVLDFSRVEYIDTTGLLAIKDLKADVKKYGGEYTEVRFVGLKGGVRERFERFGWPLVEVPQGGLPHAAAGTKSDKVYTTVIEALQDRDGSLEWIREQEEIPLPNEKV